MLVKVSFTVDIDPQAWTQNYGVEGAAAIREDVERYIESGAVDQLSEVGVLVEK